MTGTIPALLLLTVCLCGCSDPRGPAGHQSDINVKVIDTVAVNLYTNKGEHTPESAAECYREAADFAAARNEFLGELQRRQEEEQQMGEVTQP